MPIDPIFAGLIGGVASSGANLAAQKRARNFALEDRKHFEAYNHPRAVLARMREAGLPAAAFFGSGAVGGQTSMPRATEVNPDPGVAKGLEAFMSSQALKMQNKIAEQQLRSLKANADVDEIVANYYKSETSEGVPWKVKHLDLDFQKKSSEARRAQSEDLLARDVLHLERQYGEDLKAAQVTNLLIRNDIGRQELSDMQTLKEFQREFTEKWQSGDYLGSLSSLIGMLISKFSLKSR